MLHPTSNSHVLSTCLVAELVAETQLKPHILHIWVSSPSSVPSQRQAFAVLHLPPGIASICLVSLTPTSLEVLRVRGCVCIFDCVVAQGLVHDRHSINIC